MDTGHPSAGSKEAASDFANEQSECGFFLRGDSDFPDGNRDANFRPPLRRQILHLVPMAVRYFFHWVNMVMFKKKVPSIDAIRPAKSRTMYGVPCGGIGSGTIGRGTTGEFLRFQINPGIYTYDIVAADAFHVCVRDANGGKVMFQSVLASRRRHLKSDKRVPGWEYNVKDENIVFRGLYPSSWYEYDVPSIKAKFVCRQTSPFLPGDYKDSAMPISLFDWRVINYGQEEYSVSIGFTFKNGWAGKTDTTRVISTEDLIDEAFVGRKISQTFRGEELHYGVAVERSDGVRAENLDDFRPYTHGTDFWRQMAIESTPDATKLSSTSKDVAVAVRATLQSSPDSTSNVIRFSLCWDMPKIKFGREGNVWRRRYAKYFAEKVTEAEGAKSCRATEIISHGLKSADSWIGRIGEWQRPVLTDPSLPEWYKSAIFNELYFLADGGTVWLQFDGGDDDSDPRREFGRFAYLESHEYRLYNTYDVHFYASFALADLFPGLQLSLQSDYCEATDTEHESTFVEMISGRTVKRSPEGAVPHDLGDPWDEPFATVNAYVYQDVSEWKDLNLKFVLSIYRDILLTRRKSFTDGGEFNKYSEYLNSRAWPLVKKAVAKGLKNWDTDGDCLIENSGHPDQTYDSWAMKGPSAYCGGLWLATLSVAVEMAADNGEESKAKEWSDALVKARAAYQEKLWNDEKKFFKFDATERGGNTIMSDQLCGLWYLRMMDWQANKIPFSVHNCRGALQTVFDNNVMKFGGGRMGAVNGFRADRDAKDACCIQSQEVWTGTVYSLAAHMMVEGMADQAFATAEGVYKTVYERMGLGYETPEAYYEEKHYRAIGYMRPLSIWAIEMARRKLGKGGDVGPTPGGIV